MYDYAIEENEKVGLHDCRTNGIQYDDNVVTFEFVTTYRSYQHILFKGYVWFDTAPYHMECEIELHTDNIFYSWDER